MILLSQHEASALTIEGKGEHRKAGRSSSPTQARRDMSFVLTGCPTTRGFGRVGESMIIWSSLNVCLHGFSFCSVIIHFMISSSP